eukprot:3542154-Rhodomonas_salina.3
MDVIRQGQSAAEVCGEFGLSHRLWPTVRGQCEEKATEEEKRGKKKKKKGWSWHLARREPGLGEHDVQGYLELLCNVHVAPGCTIFDRLVLLARRASQAACRLTRPGGWRGWRLHGTCWSRLLACKCDHV